MTVAVDYLARFLDHPTWPGAIVLAAFIIAIAWVVVVLIKAFFV
jgi:hypothetical protein